MFLVSTFLNPNAVVRHLVEYYGVGAAEAGRYTTVPIGLMAGFLKTLAISAFAVVWHRLFLLKLESQKIGNLFTWNDRNFRFLIVAIALGGVGYIVHNSIYVSGFVFLSNVLGPAQSHLMHVGKHLLLQSCAAFVVGVLTVRWIIMFPSIAVDRFVSFRDGWRITKGNACRLLGVTILVQVPVFVFVSIPSFFVFGLMAVPGIAIVNPIIYMATVAIGVSALSVSYKKTFEGRL